MEKKRALFFDPSPRFQEFPAKPISIYFYFALSKQAEDLEREECPEWRPTMRRCKAGSSMRSNRATGTREMSRERRGLWSVLRQRSRSPRSPLPRARLRVLTRCTWQWARCVGRCWSATCWRTVPSRSWRGILTAFLSITHPMINC